MRAITMRPVNRIFFGSGRQSAPRGLSLAVLAAVLALPAVPAAAQQAGDAQAAPAAPAAQPQMTEPVVVVSVAGVGKISDAVTYLSEAVGQPAAGGLFSAMAATFTQGLDPNRPIGLIVPWIDGSPAPIAFIPAADVRQFLKRLEEQLGPAEEMQDDPNTLAVAAGASLVYIKQAGQWAYIAQDRQFLNQLPANPQTLLAGMDQQYDIGVRINVQQIPVQQREMIVQQLKQGFAAAAARQADGDGDQVRRMGEQTLQQLERVINETQRVLVGWSVDPANQRTFIDFEITAAPGTELAEIYDASRAIPSKFAAVIRPDAAAYYHAAVSISPKAAEQTRQSVDQAMKMLRTALAQEDDLTEQQQADVTALLERVGELAMDTVSEGKADLGLVISTEGGKLRMVGGAFVADGNAVAQLVKDLADKVKNETDAPRFTFDQGQYKGVTFHTIEADVPEDKEEARQLFGPVLQVKLGTAANAVYVAVGDNAQELIQRLVDSGESDTGAARPLGQLYVSLLPILQYAQTVDDNENLRAMIDALSRSNGTGNLLVVSESIEQGQKVRISIGEGLLRAIGAAVRQKQMEQQQQQGAQF